MIYGRPNSAYLKLGEGCRKAFAMGLHQDTQYAEDTTPHTREEKRATLWSLVFLERWVSFWMGRPSCSMSISIQAPLPSQSPVIYCLANISSIVEDIGHNIYGAPLSSAVQLWESAQQIRVKLQNIEKLSESVLGYPLDGQLSGPPLDIGQVFVMNFLCHVWMITFRPFLVIMHRWKQSSNAGSRDSTASQQLPAVLWWLPEARQLAVNYAHRLVEVFTTAAQLDGLVKGLSFSVSFLESACGLLYYDAVGSGQCIDAHLKSLEKANDCFINMLEKGPVKTVTIMTQRLLRQLQKAKDTDQERNDQPHQYPTIAQSTLGANQSVSDARANASSSLEQDQFGLQTDFDPSEFVWVPDLEDYFTSSLQSFM
ncbi:hypothetical protein LTR05_008743 [Lithohypha guttulata]|uniref:Xylanolytic transcriptional activator regulatory domain-containing protein n=1 Tax=Lithohypha guttulata TaxID=1690604 RepID=A0AAN7Q763_9EURO|nr:hypothetical protein LTR05_008743 [Lithohypha guttulata]